MSNTQFRWVNSVANLQSESGMVTGEVALVKGYYAPGDNGGGELYWDDAPPASIQILDVLNTTPITIKTVADHSIPNNAVVVIAGVGGSTNANGRYIAYGGAGNTFLLFGTSGSGGVYTGGGYVGDGGNTIPSASAAGVWRRANSPTFDVRTFGAKGNDSTDDRLPITAALYAATKAGGGTVSFPPGTYLVSRAGSAAYALAVPGSNIELEGVPGKSWIKHTTGLPNAIVAILYMNQQANIAIRGLGFDGNWGNAVTTIDGSMANISLPQSTIVVGDTSKFPPAGTLVVVDNTIGGEPIAYTGKTSTSFTGCTGGTGVLEKGQKIGRNDSNYGGNQTTQAGFATTITAGSNGVTLPAATINVVGTATLDAAGSVLVETSQGYQLVAYTGTTSTTLTGCTGGTGTLATGGNVFARIDPKNYGVQVQGCENVTLEDCLFEDIYGDAIWLGHSSTGTAPNSRNIKVTKCSADVLARDGLAMGGPVDGLVVRDSRFMNVYSQAFDTEPRGDFAPCRNVEVVGCYFDAWFNPAAHRSTSPMSIKGSVVSAPAASNTARKFRVRDCTIMGPVGILAAEDIQLVGNRIICDWSTASDAPILAQDYLDNVLIADNYIYDRTTNPAPGTAGSAHQGAITVIGSVPQQPSGLTIRGNRILAKNGQHGIVLLGHGGIRGDHGTATSVTSVSVTDTTKAWTAQKWRKNYVRMGGVLGLVTDTSSTSLTVSAWITPLGAPAPTPAPGAYEILATGTFATIEGNYIDCTDDGHGSGGFGIYFSSNSAPGARLRILRNEIRNAVTDAINIVTPSSPSNAMHALQIEDNVIYDDQVTATCSTVTRIAGSGLTNIEQFTLRNNTTAPLVATTIVAASSGLALPQTVITVASTAGFRSSGTIQIAITSSNIQTVTYTSKTDTEFKGCMGGTGTLATSQAVEQPMTYLAGVSAGHWLQLDGFVQSWAGFGSPEGAVRAPLGSGYQQVDSGGKYWVKESGSGPSGWVSK